MCGAAAACSAWLGCSPTKSEQTAKPTEYRDRYEQGANDALMGFALLNLEQQLQGTNRSFVEMFEIVCGRLRVEYKKP